MIKRIKHFFERLVYSLRTKMLFVIIFGAIAAACIYTAVSFVITTAVDTYYISPEQKKLRQENYLEGLQEYVSQGELSSEDTAEIAKWVRNNRYVYLLIYKDDELFFTSDDFEDVEDVPAEDDIPLEGEEEKLPSEEENEDGGAFPENGGITVDYPDREELIENAVANGLFPLELSDGTLFASIADYSEYFYYDLSNIISVAAAFLFLTVVMMIYFGDVTKRISVLGRDVTKVSDGDMHHPIKTTGKDELATLSYNIEQMRNSMLENIERERAAMNANTELITSMSHDVRTPLTVLLGYLDIMKMQTDDPQMSEYIKASEATALRLKELSDDMFGYFLVFGNESITTELMEYDALTLVDQFLSEHLLLIKEQGYDVNVDDIRCLEGITVVIDAPKAMRIIDNIFSNIRKYARRERMVNIGIRSDDLAVIISAENETDKKSTAESNGIGIKTCQRLAAAMNAEFSTFEKEDRFCAQLRIPIKQAAKD